MENNDLVPEASLRMNEATALVPENIYVEGSKKETSLTKLATELSVLSLEMGDKVTSTSPGDFTTADLKRTAFQVPTNSEETVSTIQSGDSTDIERSSGAVADDERSDPPNEEPQETDPPNEEPQETDPPNEERQETDPTNEEPREIPIFESLQTSEPVIVIRNRRLFDKTMIVLLWEVLLLCAVFVEMNEVTKYMADCDDGVLLPWFIFALSIIFSLTLLSRIIINIMRKLQCFERRSFSFKFIYLGDCINAILLVIEIGYFLTIDSGLCKGLYKNAFCASVVAVVVAFIGFGLNLNEFKRHWNGYQRR